MRIVWKCKDEKRFYPFFYYFSHGYQYRTICDTYRIVCAYMSYKIVRYINTWVLNMFFFFLNFVFIWAIQVIRLFFFNTKLWVFLLLQTNSQFLPQLSYVSNFDWSYVTFTWTHYLFFFSHQSQSATWVSCGKNCAFFCGTWFFAKLLL